MSTKTRWYAARLWLVPFILLLSVLGFANGDLALGVFALIVAVHYLTAAGRERQAFVSGFSHGVLATATNPRSLDLRSRVQGDAIPDPWEVPPFPVRDTITVRVREEKP